MFNSTYNPIRMNFRAVRHQMDPFIDRTLEVTGGVIDVYSQQIEIDWYL